MGTPPAYADGTGRSGAEQRRRRSGGRPTRHRRARSGCRRRDAAGHRRPPPGRARPSGRPSRPDRRPPPNRDGATASCRKSAFRCGGRSTCTSSGSPRSLVTLGASVRKTRRAPPAVSRRRAVVELAQQHRVALGGTELRRDCRRRPGSPISHCPSQSTTSGCTLSTACVWAAGTPSQAADQSRGVPLSSAMRPPTVEQPGTTVAENSMP